ncbi:MAG: hypothetical protein WDZ49_07850 [Litorilinea sp.]
MATYPVALDTRLAFQMKACTYAEFLAATPLNRTLLAVRGAEARQDAASQWFLAGFPDVLHWIVVVSEESPETAILLPLLARLAASSVRLDLRVVRDTEGFDELAAWLEECGTPDVLNDADLPLLFMFDEDWQLQEQWGPFPQAMEPYLEEWLERHPEYETLAEDETFDPQSTPNAVAEDAVVENGAGGATPEAQAAYAALLDLLGWEMRVWFNSGLDVACAQEICDLMRGLMDEDSEDDGSDSDGSDSDEGDE